MTAKELKEALADCPDETVITIVNYRGWLSRGLTLMEEPLRMVNDHGKEYGISSSTRITGWIWPMASPLKRILRMK